MARGLALKDAAEHLHLVALGARRHQVRLARAAAVHLLLDGLQIEGQPRLHAVQHHPHRRPMAFAEGDDAEGSAEG